MKAGVERTKMFHNLDAAIIFTSLGKHERVCTLLFPLPGDRGDKVCPYFITTKHKGSVVVKSDSKVKSRINQKEIEYLSETRIRNKIEI